MRDAVLVNFPVVKDQRGNISFIEADKTVPFNIKRVYYLFDISGGAERGGHAHKSLKQCVIAMSGSFDVLSDNGQARFKYHLNRPYQGLLLTNMLWREIDNFSGGSVCMVLASEHFDEADYIRNYQEFLQVVREK